MNDQYAAVLEQVRTIINEVVGGSGIPIDANTTADQVRGWDSLTHIQIILAIEKAFSMRMKAAEVAQLDRVGALVDVILSKARSR